MYMEENELEEYNYREDVRKFQELREKLVGIMEKVSSRIEDIAQGESEHYIVLMEGNSIEIYYREVVDPMLMVSIDMVDLKIIGHKMNMSISKEMVDTMIKNKKHLQADVKILEGRIAVEKEYRMVKNLLRREDKSEAYQKEHGETLMAITIVDDYIKVMAQRNTIVEDLASLFHDYFNYSSPEFPYLRFSKEFNYLFEKTEGEDEE
jgi:hypothetical protein